MVYTRAVKCTTIVLNIILIDLKEGANKRYCILARTRWRNVFRTKPHSIFMRHASRFKCIAEDSIKLMRLKCWIFEVKVDYCQLLPQHVCVCEIEKGLYICNGTDILFRLGFLSRKNRHCTISCVDRMHAFTRNAHSTTNMTSVGCSVTFDLVSFYWFDCTTYHIYNLLNVVNTFYLAIYLCVL